MKYNGETIGQGREAVKKILTEKPELLSEIEKKVREKALTAEEEQEIIRPNTILTLIFGLFSELLKLLGLGA